MQGDDDWKAKRRGLLTASRFAALMVKKRPSATRDNLLADLVAERYTGAFMETYQSADMERGIIMEASARKAYEDHELVVVEQVDYVPHPVHWFVGCSPDGCVGDAGLVEFKCLNAANHIKALRKGQHAIEYKWQLQGQLWVCGREWVDAVAYHPAFGDFSLAIVRVYRDEKAIAELEAECIAANEEIEQQLEWFKEKAA